MGTGPRAVTGRGDFGCVEPGAPADLILGDYGAMPEELIDGLCQAYSIILRRAEAGFIEAVIDAGNLIVKDQKVNALDVDAGSAALKSQAAARGSPPRKLRPLLGRYQEGLKKF